MGELYNQLVSGSFGLVPLNDKQEYLIKNQQSFGVYTPRYILQTILIPRIERGVIGAIIENKHCRDTCECVLREYRKLVQMSAQKGDEFTESEFRQMLVWTRGNLSPYFRPWGEVFTQVCDKIITLPSGVDISWFQEMVQS